jgi:hypothetical protein
MSTQLNLKEIERKAFRSTYEDGLWDIYFGLIVICMSIFIYRPASGYSPMNIVLAVLAMSVAYSLFWAGKKYITLPRMGQVRFGDIRRKKKTTMAMFLSFVVLAQLIILGLTTLGWLNPDVGAGVNHFLKSQDLMDLTVALIGSLFVVVGMTLTAYFSDFPRGYFIAAMMALAVFLMIYLNQPVYPILIGALMIIPGAVLFFRFLKKYPLPGEAGQDE